MGDIHEFRVAGGHEGGGKTGVEEILAGLDGIPVESRPFAYVISAMEDLAQKVKQEKSEAEINELVEALEERVRNEDNPLSGMLVAKIGFFNAALLHPHSDHSG